MSHFYHHTLHCDFYTFVMVEFSKFILFIWEGPILGGVIRGSCDVQSYFYWFCGFNFLCSQAGQQPWLQIYLLAGNATDYHTCSAGAWRKGQVAVSCCSPTVWDLYHRQTLLHAKPLSLLLLASCFSLSSTHLPLLFTPVAQTPRLTWNSMPVTCSQSFPSLMTFLLPFLAFVQ